MNLSSAQRTLAARLVQGPSFLIVGSSSAKTVGSNVAEFQWNGVYTTLTTNFFENQLRNDQRTVIPTGAMKSLPSRNPSELQIRYLLGADHLQEDQRPAMSQIEAARTKGLGLQELSRLASETVTPRGVVAWEAWSTTERITSMEIMGAFQSFGAGQVHVFSAKTLRADPFLADMATSGQVVFHDESLDSIMLDLRNNGQLPYSNVPESSRGFRHVVSFGQNIAEVDIHMWNQISKSARPIDAELLTPPIYSSNAAKFQDFRSFTGSPDGVPYWPAIVSGMNVEREFENELLQKVEKTLGEKEFPNYLVLSGQTATGKSVALAALSIKLAMRGEVAVLHQSRRGVKPVFDDIDAFAAWVESNGAAATVFVWDGMVPVEEYEAIGRQLRNRGRKVLIVGSSYSIKTNRRYQVDAPAQLTDLEISRLMSKLNSFGANLSGKYSGLDTNFLTFLYRLLPETEFTLKSGLSHEMRAAELGIEKLIRARSSASTELERLSAFAAAFQAAGLKLSSDFREENTDSRPLIEQSFDERDSVQQLTTIVLVAGRHGVSVPIDLALRILGSHGAQAVRDAIESFDIIREIDGNDGDFYLGARSTLEAQLLVQNDISDETEIQVLCEIIELVRIQSNQGGRIDEIQFLVSLLERIGPNSLLRQSYGRYYKKIIDALRMRRERDGVRHPRLVLQESLFLRTFTREKIERFNATIAERIDLLEENQLLLESTLLEVKDKSLIKVPLAVELASTLGAIMTLENIDSEPKRVVQDKQLLAEILNAVKLARTIDPSNLHPVDVLAWTTRDAVRNAGLTGDQKLGKLADAVATIEAVDRTRLTDSEKAKLDGRLSELGRLLNDDIAVAESLKRLEKNNDPAAMYFLAKYESDSGPAGRTQAIHRLDSAPEEVISDWRCAQLYLDLAWQDVFGTVLLRDERAVISSEIMRGSKLDHIISRLRDANFMDAYKFQFIHAVHEFVAGNYELSKTLFRSAESLTRQLNRRNYTSLVLGNQGKPLFYTGHVERVDDRSGEVWVNELSTSVRFEPRLFSATKAIERMQPLAPFMIGFKLSRGPVAEPRGLFRSVKKNA